MSTTVFDKINIDKFQTLNQKGISHIPPWSPNSTFPITHLSANKTLSPITHRQNLECSSNLMKTRKAANMLDFRIPYRVLCLYQVDVVGPNLIGLAHMTLC